MGKEKIEKYINKSFSSYSQLTDDDDVWIAIKMAAKSSLKYNFVKVANCLVKRDLPKCYALSQSRIEYTKQINEELRKKYHLEEWQLKIDTLDLISYKHEKSPILINEINGGYADIFHESTR